VYDDGFRAADVQKNVVKATATGWEVGVETPDVTEALLNSDIGPTEEPRTIHARTEELEFAPVFAAVIPVDRHWDQTSFGGSAPPVELPPDDYLIRVETNVRVFLRVNGALTLRRDNSEALWVEFPEETAVGIGFQSHVNMPGETITVPETVEGVATALSHTSVSNGTRSPDRSWPTKRNRPPDIELGETTDVPAEVAAEKEDTGIDLVVPPDLTQLLPAASLVHYLGADVRVESDADPHLDISGRRAPLSSGRGFAVDAANYLKRVFHLDCVARGAGPHGGPLAAADTFDTLELNAERLYDAPLAERFRTYLDAEYDSVTESFPEWHLALQMEPSFDRVSLLSHVLADLPLLLRPSAERLTRKEWLRYSMTGGGFEYGIRGDDSSHDAYEQVQVANMDLVRPDRSHARTHGWMASGVPSDGFDAIQAGYENRDDYLEATGEPIEITAVVNDSRADRRPGAPDDAPTMADEAAAVAERYAIRSDGPEVDLSIRRRVSTTELAELFESRTDLIHYVGHHDTGEGLVCHDGALHHSSLAESNARTFFLNACGSYPFAEGLIERGSVVGAATFERVADTYAVDVGSTFAQLLVHGFSFYRAIHKAANHGVAPRDFVVMGNGTYSISEYTQRNPIGIWIFQRGYREFDLLAEERGTQMSGGVSKLAADLEEDPHLSGASRLLTISLDELEKFLSRNEIPVTFKRELYWPDEFDELLTLASD
jgi:hypothetical protein